MTFKSPEDFHNKLGLVFHGLLAFPLAAFVYLFLEIRNHNKTAILKNGNLSLILTILIPLCAIASFTYGYLSFKKGIPKLKCASLSDKFSIYYQKSLKFYIYIGIASVFLVAGLYLTTSAIFILCYVFLLFFMSLHRPTPQRYVKDIPLTERERKVILHKGSFEDIQSQDESDK